MGIRSWIRRTRRSPRPAGVGPRRVPVAFATRPLQDARFGAGQPGWVAADLAPVEVHPGLYAVSLLTEAGVAAVREELEAAREWGRRQRVSPEPPNSMHRGGAMLSDLGMLPWAEALRAEVLAPLAHRLFPDEVSRPPPALHAFSVDYGPGGDRQLAQHVDDALVTFNLWLGGEAEGTTVVFEGQRCLNHLDVAPRPEELFRWQGQPGQALIHRGLHRHRTEAVTAGRRESLIFWLQDPEAREALFARAADGECEPGCGAAPEEPCVPAAFVFDAGS